MPTAPDACFATEADLDQMAATLAKSIRETIPKVWTFPEIFRVTSRSDVGSVDRLQPFQRRD
jgi:hypothetical protein